MTRAPSGRPSDHWRIVQWGAVTAVGTSAWQSAASWVGGQRRFRKQRLPAVADEALTIARCPEAAAGLTGLARLQALLRAAVQDFHLHPAAAASAQACTPDDTLVLLSVPAAIAPAAAELWQGACAFWPALAAQPLRVEGGSNAAGLRLLQQGQQWAAQQAAIRHLLLVGVDSLSDDAELARAHAAGLLLTDRNGEGFIPGEAAGCVLLSRAPFQATPADRMLRVHAAAAARAGHARWPSPLQPDGAATTDALQAALQHAGMQGHHLSHALCDMDGSNWRALEQSGALTRTLDALPPGHWEPAAFLGQVGAASAPVYLALAAERCLRDRQAPNGALLWLIDAGRDSAATVLERCVGA